MNEKDMELEGLSLEEIMKEFGSGEDLLTEVEAPALEDTQDLLDAVSQLEQEPEQPEEVQTAPEQEPPALEDTQDLLDSIAQLSAVEPREEPAAREPVEAKQEAAEEEDTLRFDAEEEPTRDAEPDDTVRLDDLSQITGTAPSFAHTLEDKTERIDLGGGEESDEDSVEIKIPAPIIFRPRQRLRELKRELIAGPEKRYYELSEKGVGKLQLAMLVCLIVVMVSAGAGFLYGAGMVPENRMRLMVFSQVLVMLIGALMGCQQMIEGVSDLFRGRFTMNMLLVISLLASCADAYFCLTELRVPICAAFTLEVLMSLWSAYHKRTTEMGQMDTMRKAVRLDSLLKCEDYLDGKSAYLRGEGQVADFMEHYDEITRPERIQNIYAVVALLAGAAIAVFAGLRHGVSMGVQIFSTTLLVAVPASFFISVTRPMAMLERRLHRLGTVLCGWQGIKALAGKTMFPIRDEDLFAPGSCKMNGVKFYGKRAPEVVISYAAAMMKANGGSLEPAFEELLTSRAGIRHEAYNLQFYGNGGIGGEICEEPVLIGSLDFLKDMGVEIPEGTMVKQALYVSIDGELSGLFAISYPKMKFTATGLATLCGNRQLNPVILARDFMVTGPFLKEKFGVRTKRMIFPEHTVRKGLEQKQPTEGTVALALTTQEGLAPAAYAITGARAVRTAWKLGLVIHLLGGILGILIMAALGFLGSTELLTPLNILAYQLVWLVPGLLVTCWPRTI